MSTAEWGQCLYSAATSAWSRSSMQSRPTIALCVIARNEEQFIADCLDSARPFVDEIILVDTGSTDRTVELGLEHGARVVSFPWINDFSAARNAAIEAATTDWILMLDADERLTPESGPVLHQTARRAPDSAYSFCLQVENQLGQGQRSNAHFVTRFFRRHADLRFVGAIHEELTHLATSTVGQVLYLQEARILHLGYEPSLYAARNKDERNMRLLLGDLEHQPDSARLLYYVAQQHCSQQRYKDAIPYFERFLANRAQLRSAFTAEIYRMWLEALLALRRLEEVKVVVEAAQATNSLSRYAYEMLGVVELEQGRPTEALQHFLKAV